MAFLGAVAQTDHSIARAFDVIGDLFAGLCRNLPPHVSSEDLIKRDSRID